MMLREYRGAAASSVLTDALGGSISDVTIVCDNLSNWPTGSGGRPFFVVIDRGKVNEEKILCSERVGNVLTVFSDGLTNGRGADDTSISSHNINAVIEHIFTATDAAEANIHINAVSNVHGVTGTLLGSGDIADVVRLDEVQTVTNKTIDFTQNTILNLPSADDPVTFSDVLMLGGM